MRGEPLRQTFALGRRLQVAQQVRIQEEDREERRTQDGDRGEHDLARPARHAALSSSTRSQAANACRGA
jgi:hypothetical protein